MKKPPPTPPKHRTPYILMSQIAPQPVEWAWKNRIPLGEITLIDADPAASKSCITLDLAARVSTGREMPDGTKGVEGGVVLLIAEDSLRKPRAVRTKRSIVDWEASG